jgi:hypothetical protein
LQRWRKPLDADEADQTLLFSIKPFDVFTYATVAALLLATALIN